MSSSRCFRIRSNTSLTATMTSSSKSRRSSRSNTGGRQCKNVQDTLVKPVFDLILPGESQFEAWGKSDRTAWIAKDGKSCFDPGGDIVLGTDGQHSYPVGESEDTSSKKLRTNIWQWMDEELTANADTR